MKPNIFIVGPSGSGKSTSLRNLDPETTIVLNTEQKALPFRKGLQFKLNVPIANMKEFHVAFQRAIESTIAKVIVVESFTSLVEQQYTNSKAAYQNHAIWSDYKDEIQRVLNLSKGTDKYIVFLGLDAVIEGANGVEERYIFVQGSLKKQVEKEFVMVLYTDMITTENGSEYQFVTNKQAGYENTGIKSPMDMLPLRMPNDINEVINHIENYYSEEELAETIVKEEVDAVVPQIEAQPNAEELK
jgi:adenosyl cobinamide kinase/adenosyl cobinamide phosphate guanylyltransferase